MSVPQETSESRSLHNNENYNFNDYTATNPLTDLSSLDWNTSTAPTLSDNTSIKDRNNMIDTNTPSSACSTRLNKTEKRKLSNDSSSNIKNKLSNTDVSLQNQDQLSKSKVFQYPNETFSTSTSLSNILMQQQQQQPSSSLLNTYSNNQSSTLPSKSLIVDSDKETTPVIETIMDATGNTIEFQNYTHTDFSTAAGPSSDTLNKNAQGNSGSGMLARDTSRIFFLFKFYLLLRKKFCEERFLRGFVVFKLHIKVIPNN